MARRAKIAISLDQDLLASIERLRVQTGESRSAVIGRAIMGLTAREARAQQVERYAQAYRECPEDEAAVAMARQHAKRLLAQLPWEGDK